MTEALRYRARLAYVGTRFCGWQAQENTPLTVQAVFEAALGRLEGSPVRAHAAGRTDAGVHADGQIVHFDLSRERDAERILEAVNALLPWDVRVMAVEPAAPGFHARRDAVWKEYVYRWSRARAIAPKDALFVAPLSWRADASRMREAARPLEGEHDFGVFGVQSPRGEATRRHLHFVRIEEEGDEVRALFRGDAFLRGMVRSLCGLLADAARGKAPPERAAELLRTRDRRLLSPKAEACGLTLLRVFYPTVPPPATARDELHFEA